MADKTATLKLPDGKTLEFPVLHGTTGPDVVDIRTLYGKSGWFTYDPGFLSTASCSSAITYIDGDQGILLYRGYPIEQLAAALRLPRGLLPPAVRRAAQSQAEGRVRRHRHAPHHGARAAGAPVPGIPARRASDGGDGRRGRRAVGLLPRRARHQRPAPPRDLGVPPDRQDADHRRHVLQVLDRPAVHVPEERPVLQRELHAHDVRRADRGVQGQRRAGARDGPHLHPARRPRAERLDLDGAAVRLLRRQPVRLHRRRHRLAVGPGARRRQRGLPADAGGDRRRLQGAASSSAR